MAIHNSLTEKFEKFDWDKLLRPDLGDSGNLYKVKDNFNRIKTLFEKILLYKDLLEEIPNQEDIVAVSLTRFIHFCNTEILEEYTDINQRSQKVQRVREQEDDLIGKLSPILNYLQTIDPKNQVTLLKKEYNRVHNMLLSLEKDRDEAHDTLLNLQENLSHSREIGEGQSVQQFGRLYEHMAEGDFDENKKCIKKGNIQRAKDNQHLMYISLLFAIIISVIFLYGEKANISLMNLESILLYLTEADTLIKIIVLSGFGYLVAHFSRNYSAEMNMYYHNKQRQMSLDTHEKIIKNIQKTDSSNDLETRNIILTQISKTMFGLSGTGYLKNQDPTTSLGVVESISRTNEKG